MTRALGTRVPAPGGEANIIGARGEQGGLAKNIFVHEGQPQAV